MDKGVSIITVTKRPAYIKNIFLNYNRQLWEKKELIIIVHNDHAPVELYRKVAKRLPGVSVHQMPKEMSLGKCLNFGVDQSKYDYIAKFDDDDYYSPAYLTDAMRVFERTNADVIGKSSHYIWLEGKKLLVLRSPDAENQYVEILPGATLVIKKHVFSKVRFADRTVGEDSRFCRDCKAQGLSVYSAGRSHFIAIRRRGSQDHTWRISDSALLSGNVKIFPRVKNIFKFVTQGDG
ncbi:glycosyltransferase [Brevibacillus sp. B_LB10_24]|uniref:glycosyltransferase n=1 Tax=Brevibacillus sp. B_LB10_24 TaxID=3380645 RepID=UPI0038BD3AE0